MCLGSHCRLRRENKCIDGWCLGRPQCPARHWQRSESVMLGEGAGMSTKHSRSHGTLRRPLCQRSIPSSTIISFRLPPSPPKHKIDDLELNKGEHLLLRPPVVLSTLNFGGRGGDKKLMLVLWSVVRMGHCGDRCVRRPPRTSRSEVPRPRGKNTRRNIGYRLDTVRNAWENTGYRQSNLWSKNIILSQL